MTPYQAAILCRQRLNLPTSEIPRLLTYIDPALERVARETAANRSKRKLLLSDEMSVCAEVTSEREQYYADLTTVTAATVYASTVVQSDVTGTAAQSETYYPDGLRVRVTYPTGGGSWTGIAENTDYWIFLDTLASPGVYNYKFAASPANAFKGTGITMATDDTGDVIITPVMDPLHILKEYLEFGTVRHQYQDITFTESEINAATDSVDLLTQYNPYPTGTAVRILDASNAITGVDPGTTYYLIDVGGAGFQFASSYANALAGTELPIAQGNAGTVTVQAWGNADIQLSENPQFAGLAKANAIDHIYGWLESDRLVLSGVTDGCVLIRAPFVPSLDTLPERLEDDFIDAMVAVAMMDNAAATTNA